MTSLIRGLYVTKVLLLGECSLKKFDFQIFSFGERKECNVTLKKMGLFNRKNF